MSMQKPCGLVRLLRSKLQLSVCSRTQAISFTVVVHASALHETHLVVRQAVEKLHRRQMMEKRDLGLGYTNTRGPATRNTLISRFEVLGCHRISIHNLNF